MIKSFCRRTGLLLIPVSLIPTGLFAQADSTFSTPGGNGLGALMLMILLLVVTLAAAIYLAIRTLAIKNQIKKDKSIGKEINLEKFINSLDNNEIDKYLNYRQMNHPKDNSGNLKTPLLALLFATMALLFSPSVFAQAAGSLFREGGVIITLILILTPILVGIVLMIVKVSNLSRKYKQKRNIEEAQRLSNYLKSLPEQEITDILRKRKEVLDYKISQNEHSGTLPVEDKKGILKNVNEHANIRFIEEKRKAIQRPGVNPQLSKLVIWFLISATVWLVFGTTVGEYEGIKFVAPDADHLSWLSFGRLRPVHTNAVFWGWSSMAMIGLGYYVIPRVGNNEIANLKWGWWTLWLINASVLLGSLALMAGINNGGGEYREYIWPIQLLFAIGVVLDFGQFS